MGSDKQGGSNPPGELKPPRLRPSSTNPSRNQFARRWRGQRALGTAKTPNPHSPQRYWHIPLRHCAPLLHATHAAPLVPHAVSLVEVTHVLSGWQQPNRQLVASQLVKWHAFDEQS